MSAVAAILAEHARRRPTARALDDLAGRLLSWRELRDAVEARVRALRALDAHALGILCDNGIEWVVSDLAAHVAGLPTVPLPTFFSPDQLAHVCRTSGLDVVVTDQPERAPALGVEAWLPVDDGHGWLCVGASDGPAAPFQKITFTSGTTGTPKGVCLGRDHLELVARTLAQATGSLPSDVHLCCLPLSILLENLAGVVRSLLSGGTVLVPALARVGLHGAQQFDPFEALATIRASGATSAILVPEMLGGLALAARQGARSALRYIGVGGARVAPSLLEDAHAHGLPAYEGYGLSEFASVVALNTPDDARIGASGRPLPHVDVRISEREEIEIRGPHFMGYLTPHGLEAPAETADGFLRTGDRGAIGVDGFLRVTGRLRNVLITSFGRNVSPEWVESELLAHPAIAQAVVYGDGAPTLEAVVVARGPAEAVRSHLIAVNARMPDYARIARCVVTDRPFSAIEGLTHPTGAPRRDAVARRYVDVPDTNRPQLEFEPWAFTTVS